MQQSINQSIDTDWFLLRNRNHIIRHGIEYLAELDTLSHNLPRRIVAHVHVFLHQAHRQLRNKDRLHVANDPGFIDDLVAGGEAADLFGETDRQSV